MEKRANIDEIEAYDWQIHRVELSGGLYGVVCYFYDLSEQKRLEETVRRTAERDAFLVKLNDVLRPLSDPIQIQRAAVNTLGAHLEIDRVLYGELSEDGKQFVIAHSYLSGRLPDINSGLLVSSFEWAAAILRRGQVLVIDDVNTTEGLSDENKAAFAAINLAATITIPLVKGGRWVSNLSAHHGTPRHWSREEISIVLETAERTWAAVERARAEEVVRRQDRLISTINDSTDDLIFVKDLQGRLTYANQATLRVLGLTSDEAILGEKTVTFTDQTEIVEIAANDQQVIDSGEAMVFEERYTSPDKQQRIFLSTKSPLFDASNTPVGVVGVSRDITERNLAEDALRASESRFRGIVSQSITGIAAVNTAGEFVTVNDRYCEMVGYSSEELLSGMKMEDLTHPDDLPANLEKFQRLLRDGEPFEIGKRYVHKNGSLVWVHNCVYALMNSAGETESIIAVSLDVTERRRAEEALKESRASLQAFYDSSPLMMGIAEVEGDRIYAAEANVATGVFFGTDMGGLSGRDTFSIQARQVTDYWLARYEEARSTGKPVRFEYDHADARGNRWVAATVSYLGDSSEGRSRFSFVAEDITERKRSEDDIRSANQVRREKEMLQTLVSAQEEERKRITRDLHDVLGQKLTALRLTLSSLASLPDENARIKSFVSRLQELSAELDSDVEFLAWELRPTMLDTLGLEKSLEAYVLEWSRHDGCLAVFESRNVADKRLSNDIETNLYRVVQEALNNVAKHSGATRVDVLLDTEGDDLRLILEDNGCGFEQSDEVHSTGPGGVGLLGMKERVSIIGGTIEIESGKDSGTTIFIRVPIHASGKKASSST